MIGITPSASKEMRSRPRHHWDWGRVMGRLATAWRVAGAARANPPAVVRKRLRELERELLFCAGCFIGI